MTSDQSRSTEPNDNPQPDSRLLLQVLAAGPLTPARCEAILAIARQDDPEIPWNQRVANAMDPGEREHVHRVWVVMTCAQWLEAFELLREYQPHDQG